MEIITNILAIMGIIFVLCVLSLILAVIYYANKVKYRKKAIKKQAASKKNTNLSDKESKLINPKSGCCGD